MGQVFKPYRKDAVYSYSLGAFPTRELIASRPQDILKIVFSTKSTAELPDLCQSLLLPYEINDYQLSRLSKADNTYAVGIFSKYTSVLDAAQSHLVLDQVADMGNMGTIIRTMLGFGIKNLALIRPSSDIFDPKVIRASMGAIFKINFTYFDSFPAYKQAFPRAYYPFISNAKTEVGDIHFTSPYSLIFGNESAGLPSEYDHIGHPVRIPQTGDIDSLNLSIAAAIGLYHAFKGH